MNPRISSRLFLLVAVLAAGSVCAAGSDLDDGISKYTDDGISKYDGLGDKMTNSRFITLKAKAMARQANKRKDCKELEGFDNVSDSVVIQDARNLKSVINVHERSGKSTAMGCTK